MKVCCCSLPDLTGSYDCCKNCFNSETNSYVYQQLKLPGIDWEIYKEEHNDDSESVNHPSHYNQGKYEVIDVIDDWKLSFELGNAVKYIARAGHKLDKVEDLKKAIWYIQREIDNENKTIIEDFEENNI